MLLPVLQRRHEQQGYPARRLQEIITGAPVLVAPEQMLAVLRRVGPLVALFRTAAAASLDATLRGEPLTVDSLALSTSGHRLLQQLSAFDKFSEELRELAIEAITARALGIVLLANPEVAVAA